MKSDHPASQPGWRFPDKPLPVVKPEQTPQPSASYPNGFYVLGHQTDGSEQQLVACPYVPLSRTDGRALPIASPFWSSLDGESLTLVSFLSKTHLFLDLEQRKEVQNA